MTIKSILATLMLAVTLPTTVAGVTFTIQNPETVKDWFNGDKIVTTSSHNKEIEELRNEIAVYKEMLAQAEGDEKLILQLQETIKNLETQVAELEEQLQAQQRVEITDWTFFENSVSIYKGTAEVVNNIPSSYSMEFIPSTEELQFEDLDSCFEYIYSFDINSFYKVTFNGMEEKYFDYISFTEYLYSFMKDNDPSSLFPAKVQIGEVKFYEGNDYQVDTINSMILVNGLYENNVSELVIPENIKKIDVNAFSTDRDKYVDKVTIQSNEVVLFVDRFASSTDTLEDINIHTNIYVKAELLEEYKATYLNSADKFFAII